MAKRKPGLHLIMANRLDDGRVVFMDNHGQWHADACLAAQADGSELEILEAKGRQSEANNLVIDLQVAPAEDNGPSHIKNRIQATGPTVRRDLGRQAGNP